MNPLSQNPIFIVGFPRSGTTLLQSMLATQDSIYSFPETHFFTSTRKLIETNTEGFIQPACLDSVFKDIKKQTDHAFSGGTVNEIRNSAEQGTLTIKLIFEYLVTDLLTKQIDKDQLMSVRWIEKTPGHIKHLDTILSCYPDAKFIEIIRNPMNAIYSYKEKLPDSSKHTFAELAHQWKNGRSVFERFSKANSDKTFSVRYENLTADPTVTLRKIAEFLGFQLDTDQLKNRDAVAERLVLDREVWKTSNKADRIFHENTDYEWKVSERLKTQYILRDELISDAYCQRFGTGQQIYNMVMSFLNGLSNFKILAPFSRITKPILQKLGIWPYSNRRV